MSSILKDKASKQSQSQSTRRNVSFSASTIARAAENPDAGAGADADTDADVTRTAPLPATRQSHKKGNTEERLYARAMNDEEDDAFDPSAATSADEATNQERQIRIAKSKRALKRTIGEMGANAGAGIDTDFDFDDEGDANAEEEVDEHYSLVHDDEPRRNEPLELQGNGSETEAGMAKSKTHCPIEPFNMTAEREGGEGYFDGDTYVFRRGNGGKNADEEEDAWLDNLDEDVEHQNGNGKQPQRNGMGVAGGGDGAKLQSSESAIESMLRNNNKSNAPASSSLIKTNMSKDGTNGVDYNNGNDLLTKEQIYDQLLPLLATDTETILQALGRYGAIIKRERKQIKKRNRQSSTSATGNSKSSAATATATTAQQNKHESASTRALDRITELSNLCMMKFDDTSIYDHDRAFLQKVLQQSDVDAAKDRKRSYFNAETNGSRDGGIHKKMRSGDAKDAAGPSASTIHARKDVQWEYRGNQDHSIHGPYTSSQMLEWVRAGYFTGPTAVDVRMVQGEKKGGGEESAATQEVVDDLLGDLEDSDDENGGDDSDANGKANDNRQDWKKSDEVDFASFL
jgi:hypothetical protein